MATEITAAVSALVAGFVGYLAGQAQPRPMDTMPSSVAPTVKGFYKGQEIMFIHTEASDSNVADMLTRMMGAKVILVSSLARVPASLLSDVFVFTNGVKDGGPFGFQADVFSSTPSDEEYTPLRALNLVAWNRITDARELRSVEEVRSAESSGEVAISRPGVVVNMPIISWPGGHR